MNLEEINYILQGVEDKYTTSGNSYSSTLAPQWTPHPLTGSSLLQLGTIRPNSLHWCLMMFFLWEDSICSSPPSCSQVKLILFWYFLSCPRASSWQVRPFWSTSFSCDGKGNPVESRAWHCLIVLPSERIQHKSLSPGALRGVADTWVDHHLGYGSSD